MKKIYVIGIVLVLYLTSATTVYGKEYTRKSLKPNVRIVNLSENISQETIKEITSSVGASLIYNDGTMLPIDFVVTIDDIESTKKYNNNFRTPNNIVNTTVQNSYIVTIAASTSKLVSDSGDKNTNKTSASATLQLKWLDVFGPSNKIEKVSGTLTLKKGTVSSGTVRYGDGSRSAILWDKHDVSSKSSFAFYPNKTVFNPTADYRVAFKDEDFAIYLYASASIFQ